MLIPGTVKTLWQEVTQGNPRPTQSELNNVNPSNQKLLLAV